VRRAAGPVKKHAPHRVRSAAMRAGGRAGC
jgi:hypothetical protein